MSDRRSRANSSEQQLLAWSGQPRRSGLYSELRALYVSRAQPLPRHVSATERHAVTLIGLLAGILTTGCWLPQVIHTWTRGRSDQISGLYLTCFATGVGCWFLYGVSTGDL